MTSESKDRKGETGWKEKLDPERYRILREKGTEPPFSGTHLHLDAMGTFVCGACGNPLFSSRAKFDSGTGWPSFAEAIPGAVILKPDTSHGMERTEALCAECGSHLGHVFDDGPEPGKKRYCVNSLALDFTEG